MNQQTAKSIPINESSRCQHRLANRTRCRLPVSQADPRFCPRHALSPHQQADGEALAAELLASTGDLSSADEVNALLGNLVRMLAHKRIDRKDAIAIAYMSQLLLNTLTPLERQLKAEQKAASERQFAQRLAEINARPFRESAAAAPPARQTAPSRPAPPPPANVAPADSAPSQPPKTYADVRT